MNAPLRKRISPHGGRIFEKLGCWWGLLDEQLPTIIGRYVR